MNRVQQLARQPSVQEALACLYDRLDEIIDLTISVQQIPAPTFSEGQRAAFVRARFAELGLEDVHQDALENVYGRLKGAQETDPVVVTAHLDTVFDKGTDLTVRRNGSQITGPGIADNSMGVGALLMLAETVRDLNVELARDVWFVANVGEEGLGNLRGIRAVVERIGEQGTYVVLEGGLFGYVCHQAIGVRRYRIEVSTPGGHSWGAFGMPSATHLLGHLIAGIDGLLVPESPKTTYNVGVVEGGTTINAIARRASMLLDLRSEEEGALQALVAGVEQLVERFGSKPEVRIRMEQIGNRPAGQLPAQAPLVRWSVAALKEVGFNDAEFTMGSTDANIPLSRGLPAVCLGITRSGNTHRPDEYMEVDAIPQGLGQALLVVLAAAS
jgi:acetylornithine deacetylase/succinyl-diaminopimelate desuccinylase-like protein